MLVLCLAVGMLGQIAMLLQPKYAETLIHASQSKADLTVPLAALVALLAGAALSAMIQQMLLAKMSEGMAEDIRSQLARSFFSLPVLTQESRSPGWYSQRISNDVDLVKRIPGQFISVVQSVFVMTLSFLVLVSISPATLVIGAGFGLLSILFSFVASRPISEYRKRVQESILSLTVKTQEFFLTNRILRSYNAWAAAEQSIISEVKNAAQAGYKLSLLNGFLSPISSVLMQVANIGTILFASWQVANGSMDFSKLVVFLMYFSYFSSSVTQSVNFISYLREAIVGIDRIAELEDFGGSYFGKKEIYLEGPSIGAPSLHFSNVSFRYGDANDEVLSNVSFYVPAGKTTVLVGSSGGGKTTCLGLVEMFFSPAKGEIFYGETDISLMKKENLRGKIGYIDQSSSVISGTVRDNLKLGNRLASDSEMRKALDAVGLCGFGIDDKVGERGLSLSGGQRQRLSLARAIVKDPPLLVLDEPTSCLDGITEQEIDGLFKTLFKGKTIFYSAHRLSSILSADWVVVLNEGKVEGQGNHRDLYEKCPYYRKLIDSQMAIGAHERS